MRYLFLFFGLAGLFLGWNMPNHYPLWTTFHAEMAAAIGASLVFLGLITPASSMSFEGLRRSSSLKVTVPSLSLGLPISAWVWVGLSCLPLLQFLAGRLAFRGDAALGVLYGTGAGMCIYAGRLWSAQSGRALPLKAFFSTIALAALVASGLAIAQWLQLPPAGWWVMEQIGGRPFANLAQPNHFGLLTVMGIISAVALYEMDELRHRWSLALTLAVLWWGLSISLSRASQLAIVCLAATWFLTHRRTPSRLRLREVVLACLVAFALYLLVVPLQNMLDIPVEVRPSVASGGRRWIWAHFGAAIMDRPWLGFGFEQGVEALQAVATRVHVSENSVYAHNFVLDLMTWAGVPIGLAVTLMLGAWIFGWLKKTDSTEFDRQRHWVFAVWLALGVQSLVEFPYALAYFLLPATLLAGVITPVPTGAANRDGVRVVPGKLPLLLGLGTIALLFTIGYEYLQLEDDFRANRYERARFVGRPVHEFLRDPIILDQLSTLNETVHIRLEPGMSPRDMEVLRLAARRFHLLPTRMDYAKALALNGRFPDAQYQLETVRVIFPPEQFKLIIRDWCEWLTEQHMEQREKACLASPPSESH
jgi:O-antigen ligase